MVRVLNIYVEVEEADEDGVWGYRANIRLGHLALWRGAIHYNEGHAVEEAENQLALRLEKLLA